MPNTRCRSATNSTEASRPTVVVWGNCQAAPIAELLRAPLAAVGLDVLRVPPVYLVTASDLAALRPALDRCAVFVTQPVAEAAFGGGRGSDTVAATLPPSAVVVRFPISYWTGPFPFQVHGHGADGARVDAAVTDYHDVRAAVAARRGLSADRAAAWWPSASVEQVRERAGRSLAELRRREHGLDVTTSDLLTGPDALWTMTHPTNAALLAVTGRIMAHLGVDASGVAAPAREFLGERRAPVDASVVDALGWPGSTARDEWTVGGSRRPLVQVLTEQLAQYRARPDVVDDIFTRHGATAALLSER